MRCLSLLVLAACAAAAEPDLDTLEQLALGDRAAAIARLSPGSAEQWYWRVVQAQLSDPAAAAKLIDEAAAALHDDDLIRRLRLRQAAITWDGDAQAGRRLAEALIPATAPTVSATTPAEAAPLIAGLDFWHTGEELDRYEPEGLARLLTTAAGDRRHAILGRLEDPTAPTLVTALAADADDRPDQTFGSLPVHLRLTTAQLAELAVAVPRFADQPAFLRLRLQQRAGEHAATGWQRDPAARRSYALALLAAADRPVLAWVAVAAQEELLLLDAVAGCPEADRLAAWHAATAAARAAPEAIPLAEVRGLTGLPEREVARLIELAADRLLGAVDQPPAWAACLGAADLPARHAAARVLAGRLDPAHATAALGGAGAAQALKDRRELDLWPGQETAVAADAKVSVRLVAKRLDRLALRIWRLDEEAVLRGGGRIEVGIDLAGIEPLATVEVPLRADPWLRQEAVVPLPQIDAPGTWLVEALGSDRAVRLLVRRGAIEVVVSGDAQGNRAVVIDELGRVLPEARVWLDALCLRAGADGIIRLPDGRGSHERVVAAADGRACAMRLDLPDEAYRLDVRLLTAREHLLAGTTATLVVGARISRNRTALPIGRLREPVLTLRWSGRDDRRLGVQRQTLALADDRDAVVKVLVPEGAMYLAWTLEGGVQHRSTGSEERLSSSGSQDISPGIASDTLGDPVLRRDADGWLVSLRGRAGEALPGRPLDLAVQHRLATGENPGISLRTDGNGELHLGPLPNAGAILVHQPGENRAVWRSELIPPELPPDTLRSPGETLELQLAREPRVFRVAGGCYLAELPQALRRAGRGWLLRLDQPGDYRLHDGRRQSLVQVRHSVAAAGLRLGSGLAAEVPPTPASLSASVSATALELDLGGLNAGARIHLLPLRLWPGSDDLQLPRGGDQPARIHDWLPPEGACGRRSVDAEEWYSLNRRQQPHLAGVMLDRPGPLLDPWHPQDGFAPWLAEGGRGGSFGSRSGGGSKRAVGKGGGSKGSESWGRRLAPDWLAAANPVLDHLRPDAKGHLSVPLDRLGDALVVVALASDGDRLASAIATLPLRPLPLPLRERRLVRPLPADATVGVASGLSALQAGERFELTSLAGSQVRLIDSVAAFIELVHAGWPDADLGPFDRLGAWSGMDAAARRRLWDEGASHELHLFLARHDPDFAARVLTPYRSQMLVPDAMLAALCGLDAVPWLTSASELNPVERLLLAERLPAERAAPLRRAVVDAALGVEPDPRRRTAIVEALLAGAEPLVRESAGSALRPPPASAPAKERELYEKDGKDVETANDAPVLRGGLGDPKTWIESRWWHCQGRPEIEDGPLWAAYAGRDPGKPFLPVSGLECLASATELRLALALTDLPFVPAAHRWADRPDGRSLTAAGPLLLAHRLVRPLPRGDGTVSLYRRTCTLADWNADHATAAAITGPLAVGEAYVDEVVAVNLSPLPVEVALLAQIPAGSLALGGDAATTVQQARLEGYASTQVALRWYLPQAGEARQAAATATVDAHVVAATPLRTWTTAADAPAARSWTDAAEAEALLAGLARERLDLADLGPLARRCSDATFYHRALAVLRARGTWDYDIWGWSLLHHDAVTAGEWLTRNPDFRAAAEPWLRSPVLTIDTLEDRVLEAVEISPLVNPRRHRAREDGRELASGVHEAWSAVLRYVAHKPAPDHRDRLLIACLLLAQDRVEEAVPVFDAIDPTAIPARLQYDWCKAWLALARGDLAVARSLAAAPRELPSERWQKRWAELTAQLAEIAGEGAVRDPRDPATRLAAQAAAETSLGLERDPAGGVVLTAHAATEVELRFRALDLEALFARAPFAAIDGGDARRLCAVAPLASVRVMVPGGSGRQVLALPAAWRNRTAVLEAVAGGASAALVVQANDLEVRVAAASGSLTVVQRSNGTPVPAAYIKVMRRQGETVAFLKDGYTDRRGRFDHVAVNGERLPAAERFAILVEAGALGSTVVQAAGVQGR